MIVIVVPILLTLHCVANILNDMLNVLNMTWLCVRFNNT
jgi:hypothetical protein